MKKKSINKILSVALASSMVLGMAGCGGNGNGFGCFREYGKHNGASPGPEC